MHTHTSIVVGLLFLLVAGVSPVHAQGSHTAPAAALDAAVQEHVASRDADRETILRLLARPEVQTIAGNAGIDLRRAERAVTTLDGSSLAEIAAQARQAEQALAGGQSRITISTTLIIIVLLLLILIIVAVD
jgi:hypothetical protein